MPYNAYRKLIKNTDGSFSWTQQQNVPTNLHTDLVSPAVIGLTDLPAPNATGGDPDNVPDVVGDDFIDIWFPTAPGDDPDTDIRWYLYDYPFVHFLNHEGSLNEFDSHPFDYADLIYGLTSAGYLNPENPDQSAVLGKLVEELQSMVNEKRLTYNLPIIPDGYVPAIWGSGVALRGGSIIRYNHYCYYVRYDLTAEKNTISPVDDVFRTSFKDFNAGVMRLPDVDDVEITRQQAANTQLTNRQVYVDTTQKIIYIKPGTDVTLQNLQNIQTTGLRLFYFVRVPTETDNRVVRVIAQANNRSNWIVNGQIVGVKIQYDPMWQQGALQAGDTVKLAFDTVEPEGA